jgi:hypothetical protein
MNNSYLLKDKLYIFNNQAKSGDSSGRLSVVHNIYPATAIFWEFETVSKTSSVPEYDGKYNILSPFIGNFFNMFESRVGSHNEIDKYHPIGAIIQGTSSKVILGDATLTGNSFVFYLPNARFQQVGRLGKNFSVKEVREGFVEAKIKNDITVKMETPIESINWLEEPRCTGTYITTWGILTLEKEVLISDAFEILCKLTYLLSFANGGFTAPLVIKMTEQDFEKVYPIIHGAFEIDTVEHINGT